MINFQEIMAAINELDESSPQKEDLPASSDSSSIDVSSFDSDKLCAIIASSRYLSANKNTALLAMEELAQRRINGDTFNFENKIDEYVKTFVPIKIETNNLSNMIAPFLTGNKR